MQGTPTAATPVPQPSLAPPPPPPPASSSGPRVDLNPTADAANALAQSTALVDQVGRDLLTLLDRCESAYEDDAGPSPDSITLLNSLANLISLLSRSALGGFVPTPPPPPSAAAAAESTPSQAQLDQASERSQTLFKQLQTVRERAEIVRAGLARS
ncbi:hypothetical protein RHOSPDRAFT_33169 [Rhodotorula sp. JG-1b]|nr:hypothetical protein RHOSPDRAFT_33169 [Rhodotorula sp. JG-1b]